MATLSKLYRLEYDYKRYNTPIELVYETDDKIEMARFLVTANLYDKKIDYSVLSIAPCPEWRFTAPEFSKPITIGEDLSAWIRQYAPEETRHYDSLKARQDKVRLKQSKGVHKFLAQWGLTKPWFVQYLNICAPSCEQVRTVRAENHDKNKAFKI